jgi:hypothetical protein
MKTLKLTLILFLFAASGTIFSQSKSDSLNHKQADTINNYSKMMDSLMNVYTKQYNEMSHQSNKNNQRKGAGNNLFGLTIDLVFGVGISKSSFDLSKDTTGLNNPNSNTGPMIGANVNIRLLGFAFGTGINYSSKGFTTNNSNSFNANYLNIPLMFTYNFDISKTEISLSAGPYAGILLSQNNSQYLSLKSIDIGIVGSVQGSYTFNNYLGALLGVKYEQGGLNNLIKTNSINNNISSMKTTNWYIYSGIKFTL